MKKDYHDYVIKEGKFIGQFEQMYKNCDNPWPETEENLENNPLSVYTTTIIKKYNFKKIFSVGSGKGLHAEWLRKKVPGILVEGCEISQTAMEYSKVHYPHIKVVQAGVESFEEHSFDTELIILREVLWYILPSWDSFVNTLKKKYSGKHILIEITCYDNQGYGREYFDGPEDIIQKFPFQLKEVLRHHVSKKQKEGMVLLFGQI